MSQQQKDFKEGDRVLYRPVGGAMQTSVGVIKKVLTHPEEVGSRHTEVKASEEMPRYVQSLSSDDTYTKYRSLRMSIRRRRRHTSWRTSSSSPRIELQVVYMYSSLL